METHKFSTIRRKLTFWFLFLTLVPLLIAAFVNYFVSSNAFKEKTFNKLTAIRDLKAGQVRMWLAERTGDLNSLARNDLLVTSGNDPSFIKSEEPIRDWVRELLRDYQYAHDVYHEIFIIDVKTGKVTVSTNPIFEGTDKSYDEYFTGPLETGREYVKDIYNSHQLGEKTMSFSVPIRSSGQINAEITGILVAYVDLKNSVYPLLLNRTGLGETGETLIVNKDKIALSNLRYAENAPLNFQITAEPAVNAAAGKTGIIISTDYAGHQVLAAYTYIPETRWGFVCKQDWSELSKPMHHLEMGLLLLFAISVLVISGVVYVLSNSLTSPLRVLVADTKKIADGDYSIRNTIHSRDEIGYLGLAINNMVAGIESKTIVETGVMAISEAVIGHTSRQKYSQKILQRLIQVTGAEQAVFYTLNKSQTAFEHLNSIGANSELLEPFSAQNPEGELGNAIISGKIEHLKDLPEDTRFRYKTSVGEIVVREIITIPLTGNNFEIMAVISLATVGQFPREVLEILGLTVSLIANSYANLLSAEQTKILADDLTRTNQRLEAQAEELQEQSEELQQQTIELQRGADELLMQNQELELQRIRVEEATRLKSEFLSNMSHELRTPLNSINALSRVLMMQAKDKLTPEENTYLEVVERNGKRLLTLINDILDLSKIEAGKTDLQFREISLSALVAQIVENLQPLAKQKKIALNLTNPDLELRISTDEHRLHQVLTNVIGNAVKFTDQGGVDVTLRRDDVSVFIEVKDSGIGISEDVLPFIFEEFRQGDGSPSRTFEGTGLGLAIAQKIIHAMHGNIKVDSKPGKGSTFTIRLPLESEDLSGTSTPSSASNPPANFNGKTILIVDDNSEIVEYIAESLRASGYHTIGTSSGKEALRLAEEYRPYAVTLDIVMPEMDGWEVLQHLKTNPRTSEIPVIIISVTDDRQTGLALGAVGYLSKPVDRNLLVSEINRLKPNPASVMIVDDDAVDRQTIHDILKQENFLAIPVESGSKCLELLQHKHPDILILDLMMPDMDGFHVLNEIKNNEKTRDLPVIIVTAKDLTPEDKSLLSGKAASILTKSMVSPKDIFAEIKRILDSLGPARSGNAQQNRLDNRKRILLVEDNAVAVLQVRKILEMEDFIVDVVNSGSAAINYVRHTIPDGIILDLMMPGIDGFEVLESIRSKSATKELPVLILTAKNLTHKELARLSANNIQQLIQKGDIDVHGLVEKVRAMLEIELPTVPQSDQSQAGSESGSGPEKTTRSDPAVSSGGKTILLIEDSADNRLTVRAVLGERYILLEAEDGEEGLARVFSEKPDLVLLDISLPKMSGMEVVRELRKNENTKNIPVIAITAKAMKHDREEILAAGCDEYVAKPINGTDLLDKINMFLT